MVPGPPGLERARDGRRPAQERAVRAPVRAAGGALLLCTACCHMYEPQAGLTSCTACCHMYEPQVGLSSCTACCHISMPCSSRAPAGRVGQGRCAHPPSAWDGASGWYAWRAIAAAEVAGLITHEHPPGVHCGLLLLNSSTCIYFHIMHQILRRSAYCVLGEQVLIRGFMALDESLGKQRDSPNGPPAGEAAAATSTMGLRASSKVQSDR